MPEFTKSKSKNKKYSVITPKGKKINFGDKRYPQFKDKIGMYSDKNHLDKKRRENYLSRAKGIKNKQGQLTYKNPESANYYSVKYLW